jgi:peptidoglycan/LPS O-acetylase OafA/YrhL
MTYTAEQVYACERRCLLEQCDRCSSFASGASIGATVIFSRFPVRERAADLFDRVLSSARAYYHRPDVKRRLTTALTFGVLFVATFVGVAVYNPNPNEGIGVIVLVMGLAYLIARRTGTGRQQRQEARRSQRTRAILDAWDR